MLEEKLQSLRDQLMVAKEEIARGNSEKSSLSKEIIQLKQVSIKTLWLSQCVMIADYRN